VLGGEALNAYGSPVDEDEQGKFPFLGPPSGSLEPMILKNVSLKLRWLLAGPGAREGHPARVVDPRGRDCGKLIKLLGTRS